MVNYERLAGRASAAAIGYIHGNLKGAYLADKIFTNKYDMPPYPRNPRIKRKRTGGVGSATIRDIATKRRRAPAPRGPAANVAPPAARRASVFRVPTPGNGQGSVLNGKNKNSVAKRKSSIKGPKPNKKFRTMVQKSLAPKLPRGIMTEVNCDYIYHNPLLDNQQDQKYIGNVGPGGLAFTPEHFLDAASVLWNQKVMAANKTILGAGNFNTRSFKARINNSWFKTEFRNNSQRTYMLSIVTLKPKSVASFAGSDPLSFWTDCLTKDLPVGTGTGPNVANMNRQMLGVSPSILPAFKQYFDMDVIKVELQAGQSYKYFLQGPKDFDFDMNKCYNGDDFQTVQKWSRWIYAQTYVDLVGTDGAAPGRILNDTQLTFIGKGIIMEHTYHYDIGIPEQAGFNFTAVTAAGTVQPLDQRSFKYAFKNYSLGGAVGNVARIDDEQPANVEINPY